jgi:hypothetical protein
MVRVAWLPSRPPANFKRFAIGGLVFSAGIVGFVGEGLERLDAYIGNSVELLFIVVFITLTFVWVHYDANEIRYARGRALNAGLLMLPLLFVPIYLLLSRSSGARLGALLRLLGFAVILIATAIGAAVFSSFFWA